MADEEPFALAARAAAALAARTGVPRHDVFVVLGSGWIHVAGLLPGGIDVPMAELPGFGVPSVEGHGSQLRSLTVGDRRILLALGRVHLYEGHDPAAVVHGVRMAAASGCRVAVLTNASGSLHRDWPVGGAVVIADQINFTGLSPLTGPSPPAERPGRFANMTGVYTPRLRSLVQEVEPGLPEGVYMGFHGPEFETPAEVRAARAWGADLVGMSTVLEVIAAAHLGLEVLGLSLATNLAAGVREEGPLDIGHVFAVAEASAPVIADLLHRILLRLSDGPLGRGMNAEAQTLRDRLGLEPIPVEGGWFRVTWRSEEVLTDGRPVGGAILALFADTPEGFSALHRLSVTELWHFHRGAPFHLLLLGTDGRSETVVLGPAVEDGQTLQLVVPPAVWMGGHVADGGSYSLVGTTTAPAFTDDAFEAGSRAALIAAYPDRAAEIRRLTRPESS